MSDTRVQCNLGFDGRTFLTEAEWRTYLRRKPVRNIQNPKSDTCAICGKVADQNNPFQHIHKIDFDLGIIRLALTPEFLDGDRNIVTAHRTTCTKRAGYGLQNAMRFLRSIGVTTLPIFLPKESRSLWERLKEAEEGGITSGSRATVKTPGPVLEKQTSRNAKRDECKSLGQKRQWLAATPAFQVFLKEMDPSEISGILSEMSVAEVKRLGTLQPRQSEPSWEKLSLLTKLAIELEQARESSLIEIRRMSIEELSVFGANAQDKWIRQTALGQWSKQRQAFLSNLHETELLALLDSPTRIYGFTRGEIQAEVQRRKAEIQRRKEEVIAEALRRKNVADAIWQRRIRLKTIREMENLASGRDKSLSTEMIEYAREQLRQVDELRHLSIEQLFDFAALGDQKEFHVRIAKQILIERGPQVIDRLKKERASRRTTDADSDMIDVAEQPPWV